MAMFAEVRSSAGPCAMLRSKRTITHLLSELFPASVHRVKGNGLKKLAAHQRGLKII